MPTAIQALIECEPRLNRIVSAKQAFDLPAEVILHAGPPLLEDSLPLPLVASAALLVMHDRGVDDLDQAEALVRNMRWLPAQNFGCVTPLAMPVSSATPLFEVVSKVNDRYVAAYAPVGAVNGIDLRSGKRDIAVLTLLQERDQTLVPLLQTALDPDEPLALLPIAAAALSQGDDLHVRTSAATAMFSDVLSRQLADHRVDDASVQWFATALQATPLFFLTVWTAACKCMSLAAESTREGTLVTRLAGNGQSLGVALSSSPERWVTMPAMSPRGPRFPHVSPDAAALGAIGDSGVIDAMGFGGMALKSTPETLAAFASFVEREAPLACAQMLSVTHPELTTSNAAINVGLDARTIAAAAIDPVVTIAMVDASAEQGLLGRGVIRPPRSLFATALMASDLN